ncbi:FG-GAP repeat protein [Aquisphaera giovannonii]|uniref:FG-GAP repeat protein n=1 Tax=Aquisphaera giovannonii TaxID=406548 RepID=A0A5B9VVM9_9BACT|nr:FG-GAP-like repeat-containing protein [Aquisphaera giovannonii]QEH31770.1 FG-GAP repeat protein [Aquisphaera giovannonii]
MKALRLFLILLAIPMAPSALGGPPPGAWLQFRGDRGLTGHSSLKGRIRHPGTVWTQFVGARATLLAVRLAGDGTTTVPLPAADAHPGRWSEVLDRWRVGPALADVDGDGNVKETAVGPQHRIGKFLADRPGLQKLEVDSLFSAQSDPPPPATARLLARRGGAWERVWASVPIPLQYVANPITGDFDGDGRSDVAVTPWYDLWVFDLRTGAFKSKARFMPEGSESGRAYGWLGAADFDGDGRQEFVVLGDFENFLAVLGWKDGTLAPLWSRLIERGIAMKKTILRTGALPVRDIDGDGRPEIVVSLHDAAGDGRWHTLALEGLTGRTRLDLPDQVLAGPIDLDGDGCDELACTEARGPLIPDRARLTVFGFKGKRLRARWTADGAAYQVQTLGELPASVNTDAQTGTATLLAVPSDDRGRPCFVTRRAADRDSGRIELAFWQADGAGEVRRRGLIAGPHLEALAGRGEPAGRAEVLVRARVPGDEASDVALSSLEGTILCSRREAPPLSTPVAGRLDPRGRPSVVVQGACDRLVAFQPERGGRPAKAIARRPGRGLYTGSGRFGGGAGYGGVVLADLLGDGSLAVVAATSSPDGHARLVAYGPTGRPLWEHDFDDLPGSPPEWNLGGLTLWFAGKFTDPRRDDVLVNIRRSTMHSDEAFLLDGRDGRQVWHRTQGANAAGNQRACGGSWMAAFDQDGDGRDDALCLYPDVVSAFDGPSGRLLLDRHTNRDVFKDVWVMYAVPAAADFLRRGRPQVLYGGNATMFALLAADGSPIWRHGPTPGWPDVLPGIGDLDGDGAIELLSVGHRRPPGPGQEVRCYDAATGRLEWTLPLAGLDPTSEASPPMAPATADLDGDGRDEAVVALGRTLLAVGTSPDGKSGAVRWSLPFPDPLGPPAIADTLGDGTAEVVVTCGDGNVYGVGGAGP